jgi:hypothetical protein
MSRVADWFLVFDSIHHVLAAERMFRDRGLWYDLVPTPRDIRSDCGMVVEFRSVDLDAVRHLIPDLSPQPTGMYRATSEGNVPVRFSADYPPEAE